MLLSDIKVKISNIINSMDPRKRSELFRRGSRNASFSMAEYFVTIILYILFTPVLVHRLGMTHYGILMFANVVCGIIGVFNFGLGEATVRYVSLHRGRDDHEKVILCIRSTLTVNLVLSVIMILAGFILAPLLVYNIFRVSPENHTLLIGAIRLASIVLGLRTVNSIFIAVLKGYERYDLSSKINIVSSSLTIIMSVTVVVMGYGVTEILFGTIVVTFVILVVSFFVNMNCVVKFSVLPIADRRLLSEVFSFGFFSWLQGLAAMVFSQADRLIIGAMLGPSALGYYSIVLQIAQQTHGITGSALAFLFPMISTEKEKQGIAYLKSLYKKAVLANLLFAVLIAIPFLVGGKLLLTIWMGKEFAAKTYVTLVILVVAFFLLTLNIASHFTLLGLGEVKFVSATNIAGGILSLIGMLLLIPAFGINGAALSRIFYVPLITLNFIRVKGKLKC